VTFWNDGDCADYESQSITLRSESNGVGNFVVMETKKWSASDVDSLVAMLRKFEAIAGGFLGDDLKAEDL
jgi:hypothetical protein